LLLLHSACTTTETPPPVYQPRPNFLALGDPIAGRNTFIELECVNCHKVAGDDFDTQAPDDAAPRLGTENAEQAPEDLAGLILQPSHPGSAAGAGTAGEPSETIDYGAMSVRQLIDVVAYIRTPARGKDRLTDENR
jgi:hypothetical protein